jgi:DNA polymerase-4
VKLETGLICSVGLAPNKLLAKIASDLDKPDGFRILTREQMLDVIGGRPASLLPGVGPKTAERLAALGVTTVEDLASADPRTLERSFGPRLGSLIRARANGIDERSLETEREPKSESRETTFASDVNDRAVLHETLERLVANLCEALARGRYRGRTVTLKIRLRPFRTHTRSRTLDLPTRDPAVVGGITRSLLEAFALDAPVRLLGVGVGALSRDAAERDPAQERLELTV